MTSPGFLLCVSVVWQKNPEGIEDDVVFCKMHLLQRENFFLLLQLRTMDRCTFSLPERGAFKRL